MKKKLKKTKPLLILIDGPIGAGKTSVASLLHKKLERTAYISPGIIKKFISGFDKYHNYEINKNTTTVMVNEYLKHGISVIVEWTKIKEKVDEFKKMAKKHHAHCIIFQLDAPQLLRIQRVKKRTRALLGKKKLPDKNIKNIIKNIKKNQALHGKNKHNNTVFNSKKLTVNKIVELILDDIKSI